MQKHHIIHTVFRKFIIIHFAFQPEWALTGYNSFFACEFQLLFKPVRFMIHDMSKHFFSHQRRCVKSL